MINLHEETGRKHHSRQEKGKHLHEPRIPFGSSLVSFHHSSVHQLFNDKANTNLLPAAYWQGNQRPTWLEGAKQQGQRDCHKWEPFHQGFLPHALLPSGGPCTILTVAFPPEAPNSLSISFDTCDFGHSGKKILYLEGEKFRRKSTALFEKAELGVPRDTGER